MTAAAIAAACGSISVDQRFTATAGVDLGQFGYDAATSEGKRRPATGILRDEDRELPPNDRRRLISQARELHRNFTVAGWMIRRHLDYVSTFNFQAKTGNTELNHQVERLMANWSKPDTCDVAGRLSLASIVRLAEARAVIDGDCGLHKLLSGHVQGIEGDRIRSPIGGLPPAINPEDVVHGVQVHEATNRAIAYCITKRTKASDFAPNGQDFVFQKMLPAQHMHLHGFFDRFDQVRGISPLAPGLNSLVDLYEGLDLALCRMKIHQLFALAFFRGDPASITTEQRGEGQDYTQLLLGKRPLILDMDIGDRAEFLESKTPSTEFQAFTTLMIQLTLKALDIPFSFFSENFTNYSGARQALLQYEQSAQIRRNHVRELLDNLTAWRLLLFMLNGQLPIMPLEQIGWEWVASGLPWLDPLKEVQADLAALSGGLTSRTRILKSRGEDFESIARELAEENKLLDSLGLPTNISPDNALIREMTLAA